MQPNINLLKDLPTQKISKYSSKTFLLLVGASFVTLLLIIYLANLGFYLKTQNDLNKLVVTQTTYLKKIEQLQKQVASLKTATSSAININVVATQTKFSPYLKKLAAYTPYGVWLNYLSLNQKEGTFLVTGFAFRSLPILEFIKSATKNQIFNEQNLSNVKIQKSVKDKSLSFSLSNKKEESKK